MTLSQTMTALMDSARNVTGLTDKLSITDLTSYLAGLVPINLLDNTFDQQTVDTKNGDWSAIQNPNINLPLGIYCYSVEIASSSKSVVTLRVEFAGGIANSLSGDTVNSWGWAGANLIKPGNSGKLMTVFEVTQAGNFNFGLAGLPWTGGEAVISKPMLNRGTLPLPFTKNKLGGVAKALLCALLPVRGCAACH